MESFLARQHVLSQQFDFLVGNLDHSRTCTLHDFIISSGHSQRVRAPWLQQERFMRRIRSLDFFLDGAADMSLYPFIFFQGTSAEEDELEKRKISALSHTRMFTNTYGSLPAQARYLFTETQCMGLALTDQGHIIRPLSMYTSRAMTSTLGDQGMLLRNNVSAAFGYRLPDYPALLGVSSEVATDYFARIVCHDIGHALLPRVEVEIESLHNISMIAAMQVSDDERTLDGWEGVVHAECSDPFFFLDAERILTPWRTDHIHTHMRSFVSHSLWRRYCSVRARCNRWPMWKITSAMSGVQARKTVQCTIDELRATAFMRYKKNVK